MTPLGRTALACHRSLVHLRDAAFSRLVRGAFEQCGPRCHFALPVRVVGAARIAIGKAVFFGPDCWLQSLANGDGRAAGGRLQIGDRCAFAGADVLSAAHRIVIEDGVLFARNVYVADHAHATGDPARAILDQGITAAREVVIERGAWLGQNVVVCPGVRIGRGAVIGAGSVVRSDVPARTVAVGAPARVVKQLAAS